jgi:hypothetical protein
MPGNISCLKDVGLKPNAHLLGDSGEDRLVPECGSFPKSTAWCFLAIR